MAPASVAAVGRSGARRPPLAAAALFVAAALVVAGCGKKAAADMPAPAPAPIVVEQPEVVASGPVSVPQTSDQLPPPQPVPAGAAPRVVGPLAAQDAASAAPAAVDTADDEPDRAAAAVEPAAAATPATEAPLPRLGRILTPDEVRARNQEIDAALLGTARDLRSIRSSQANLDAEQLAALRRIQAFVSQVEETRQDDLASAQNLAERARLLAEDLARNLR